MKTYKLGDFVKCVQSFGNNYDIVGENGNIIKIDKNLDGLPFVTVEFGRDIGGHSAGGRGKDGYCWSFVGEDAIQRCLKLLLGGNFYEKP